MKNSISVTLILGSETRIAEVSSSYFEYMKKNVIIIIFNLKKNEFSIARINFGNLKKVFQEESSNTHVP